MDDKSEHEVHQISHPLYDILRSEDMQAFNAEKAKLAELPSFAHGDFRGLDLRGMDAKGLDFRHAYFRAPTCEVSTSRNPEWKAPVLPAPRFPAAIFRIAWTPMRSSCP